MHLVTRRMTVVEVPKRNPQISGSDPKRDYAVGDTLNLTCVSAPSNPPAQLEWRLNGRPVGILDFRQQFRENLIWFSILFNEAGASRVQ